MTEAEKAEQVFRALKAAEHAAPEAALPILNGLMGLVQSDSGDQRLEVDEARSSAFLSICEVGKALHRAQPTGPLWSTAIAATERWMALVR
ncbi:hypothetical protein [Bradyrhizobium sp. Tv2a-2]|uniref:hypothetical protein n=1 Tax=Bradyrhizobium sp. Tv2a-2 TaxID=113395 RepID=UPI0004649A4B|nr:hypothetical protein [Bradyrhizobium sp. Tv2a-2]